MELTPGQIRAGRKNCSFACKQASVWANPEYRKHMSVVHTGGNDTSTAKLIAYVKSEEGRKKISERKKGKTAWNKGIKMPQISGEKAYQWITDRSKLKDDHKDRGGQLHREWSKNVKNRDGWKCKISNGDCSGRLEAHHILGWTLHPGLRYEINNGITLCHYHHPRKRSEEKELSPYFQQMVLKAD